jgi:hypothetical protein
VNSAAVGEPGNGKLLIYDNSLSGRLEMQIDPSQGYQSRAGIEYPAAGLRVLTAEPIVIQVGCSVEP